MRLRVMRRGPMVPTLDAPRRCTVVACVPHHASPPRSLRSHPHAAGLPLTHTSPPHPTKRKREKCTSSLSSALFLDAGFFPVDRSCLHFLVKKTQIFVDAWCVCDSDFVRAVLSVTDRGPNANVAPPSPSIVWVFFSLSVLVDRSYMPQPETCTRCSSSIDRPVMRQTPPHACCVPDYRVPHTRSPPTSPCPMCCATTVARNPVVRNSAQPQPSQTLPALTGTGAVSVHVIVSRSIASPDTRSAGQ